MKSCYLCTVSLETEFTALLMAISFTNKTITHWHWFENKAQTRQAYCVVVTSYPTSDPVNTGMGDRLRVGMGPTLGIHEPSYRSTQPCILPGSLNRVPALLR